MLLKGAGDKEKKDDNDFIVVIFFVCAIIKPYQTKTNINK